MVDREARDKLAQLLRQFASGRMTNDEFEDVWYYPTHGDDKGIDEVEHAIWCLYDDCGEHRLTDDGQMTPQLRHTIARWVLFLKTDLEYEWPHLAPSVWWLVAIVGIPLAALVSLLQPYRGSEIGMWAFYAGMAFFGFQMLSGMTSLVSGRLAYLMWWPILKVIEWFDDRRARECYGDAYANLDIWPFYRRADLESALSRPTLLTGPRSG